MQLACQPASYGHQPYSWLHLSSLALQLQLACLASWPSAENSGYAGSSLAWRSSGLAKSSANGSCRWMKANENVSVVMCNGQWKLTNEMSANPSIMCGLMSSANVSKLWPVWPSFSLSSMWPVAISISMCVCHQYPIMSIMSNEM
jgi:hypothetical protein